MGAFKNDDGTIDWKTATLEDVSQQLAFLSCSTLYVQQSNSETLLSVFSGQLLCTNMPNRRLPCMKHSIKNLSFI